MSDLVVRRLPFEFDGVRFLWNPNNPGFSMWGNSISFGAIGFEAWLVRVMRQVIPEIRDEAIREEALQFTEQEAVHAAAHNKHVKALIERYPGLADARQLATSYFERTWKFDSVEESLCAIAALEATFTPSFKLVIDNRRVLMGDGDARVASLLLWHFCEEIEHRSSALAVYHHLYGDRFARLRRFPTLRRRISDFLRAMRAEFRKHVPEEETRTHGQRAFGEVPRRDKWVASSRILLSQTPWHDPDRASLPRWASTWFEAYERGEEMTRFYGAQSRGM
ncbi:MAG: metal-dependent hydrolase [Deltaproteobacteria bacterium]|jgi:predicted metal-dependent hydrolase